MPPLDHRCVPLYGARREPDCIGNFLHSVPLRKQLHDLPLVLASGLHSTVAVRAVGESAETVIDVAVVMAASDDAVPLEFT